MATDKVTLAKIKMVNMGIIPAVTGNQLTKMLSSMSEVDKRIAKRKFRKAWRNFARSDKKAAEFMGLGNSKPTIHQKRNRSVIIAVEIVKSCQE